MARSTNPTLQAARYRADAAWERSPQAGALPDLRAFTRWATSRPRLDKWPASRSRQGAMAVKTENAFPVTTVSVDNGERDVGTYVRTAREAVSRQLILPAGYTLVWSGQYEFMQRVLKKMTIVVPVTLGIIFLLLYFSFGGVAKSLIVMIALAGVAAETGVVMLI